MSECRFDPERAHRLLSKEREAKWRPRDFLRRWGIRPGLRVADLGCGPGFWTRPLAELVGAEGRVWAVDVSPEMLKRLRDRGAAPNVHLIQATLPDVPLASGCADWVWVAFAYHEVEAFAEFARALRRLVRPGGQVFVLEWRPDGASPQGAPRHHRLWPREIVEWLNSAGLKEVHVAWQNADTYLVQAHG